MAKLNKASAAKIARQTAQYFGGTVKSNGEYYSHYSQGHAAWQNGEPYSFSWHQHKKEGWRKARDSDIAFAKQCPKAQERVRERLAMCA